MLSSGSPVDLHGGPLLFWFRAGYWRRRSAALATFAMIAANGGMARATADMMIAARTE